MSGAFDIQEPQSGVFAPQQPEGPPPAGDNEGKEREFVNQVRRLGRESGAGKEALPNLVVAIVDAINTGALDTKKKFRLQDGTETEAAHFILEQYSMEEGKKLMHERTPLGKKAAASKINQIIKAAKQDAFNFRGAIDRAIEARPQLLSQNDKAKLKPAFDTYVSMARAQLKKKATLSNQDIADATLRRVGYENDFVKELKRMYTRLTKLLKEDPKAKVSIPPDDDIYENMEQVAEALKAAIKWHDPKFLEPPEANEPGAGEHPQAPSREGTYVSDLSQHNAGVEQQIADRARQMEPAQ